MNTIDKILLNSKIVESKPDLLIPKNRLKLNRINAYSILLPIIAFEILVCSIGASFYHSIGYGVAASLVLAIIIESFYMYFSGLKGIKAGVIKVILLIISVTTLSYSAYINDKNVINKNTFLNSDIKDSKARLENVGKELIGIQVEKAEIEQDMKLFREYKKATKGNQVLAPRRNELKILRTQLLNERFALKKAIRLKSQELINQSILTDIKILTIKTLISIFAFSIIQLAICIALPDILNELKRD